MPWNVATTCFNNYIRLVVLRNFGKMFCGMFRCGVLDMAGKLLDGTIKVAVLHKLIGWLHSDTVTEGE